MKQVVDYAVAPHHYSQGSARRLARQRRSARRKPLIIDP